MEAFSKNKLYKMPLKILVYNLSRIEISVEKTIQRYPFDGKKCKYCWKIFHKSHRWADNTCLYCTNKHHYPDEYKEHTKVRISLKNRIKNKILFSKRTNI